MFSLLNLNPALPKGPVACAVTIGNFDGVHLGHQAMLARLREVAAQRGLPAAVMTFEPHPREVFTPDQAPARLTSLREKLELFRSHGIDRVVLARFSRRFAALTPQEFIERILITGIQARWILIGDEFRFGAERVGDFALLSQTGAAHGFGVESLPSVLVEGVRVSSTAVRDALAQGDMELAAQSRPLYSISGRGCMATNSHERLPHRQHPDEAQTAAVGRYLCGRTCGLDGVRLPGVQAWVCARR